ncbi:MAG: hypothetical protein PHO55_05755, partial [Thiomonas arsenitoxydans]|nr:hypothetical protein [Thiomonas arsenitoxydans]
MSAPHDDKASPPQPSPQSGEGANPSPAGGEGWDGHPKETRSANLSSPTRGGGWEGASLEDRPSPSRLFILR